MGEKFSVDIYFPKSVNCCVFGWIGEAKDKTEAEQLAISDARACGYKSIIKKVYVRAANQEGK